MKHEFKLYSDGVYVRAYAAFANGELLKDGTGYYYVIPHENGLRGVSSLMHPSAEMFTPCSREYATTKNPSFVAAVDKALSELNFRFGNEEPDKNRAGWVLWDNGFTRYEVVGGGSVHVVWAVTAGEVEAWAREAGVFFDAILHTRIAPKQFGDVVLRKGRAFAA